MNATGTHNDIQRLLEPGKYADETAMLQTLLTACPLSPPERADIGREAQVLVEAVRADRRADQGVEKFLREFSLESREGLALMGLAEALLRTPDAATRDALIHEKIGSANWAGHQGHADSFLVNASSWALTQTGKLITAENSGSDLNATLRRVAGRLGEPLIRRAVVAAVRLMGDQFVMGRDIEAALRRARREQLLCSFDMLGEGARSAAAAARYEQLYSAAITAVGHETASLGPESSHGISVKLSALMPRYKATQPQRAWRELYPRLERLARLAAHHRLNFTIDAEESEQLALSLQLFEALARDAPANWHGLGIVVQAYQKNAPVVIRWLAQLARANSRRLIVRLVKGAYWDSEIKRAQIAGLPGYPVYTTKAATDLSYLVCARLLIEAAPHLYPQFATHNAHTLLAVRWLAQRTGQSVEYQRLHGMGAALYRNAAERYGLAERVYAPVGGHEELLAYLVRRLLENGANSSFVHALLDERISAAHVIADPVARVSAHPFPHPRIPLPEQRFGDSRKNAFGRDLTQPSQLAAFEQAVSNIDANPIEAGPISNGALRFDGANATPVFSPADHKRVVGQVTPASETDIDTAISQARAAQPAWDRSGGAARARVLRAMGDALEQHMEHLVALLAREAGKTLEDGISEVREAADFCRYYAHLASEQFERPIRLPGPVGESDVLELHGRGIFVCISPWNFPLAIFTGQIAAALAAGNAVLAKPAEQTPLIAREAVRLFHQSGLAPPLLALLPGAGETVGASLCADVRVNGVAFTGGTETARLINQTLAQRAGAIIPFIAETGGLNGLFIDSSALPEQVIDDVLTSAFGSAGQRCSALRILFVPEQSAERLIEALAGAADTLVLGDPADPAVDMGPVIDAPARAQLLQHIERLEQSARIIFRKSSGILAERGSFLGPVIAEIPTPDFLENEVFGPILHIHRYASDQLEQIAACFAARGFGLTLGIHSRVDSFVERVRACVPAGNTYVNRSMIGAVVGVQPFGGEGLSGTGPKTGGPHSLLRYAVERSVSINTTAQGGDAALLNLDEGRKDFSE